jgi:ABC-type antimicrobial peptide transport system permease subunit
MNLAEKYPDSNTHVGAFAVPLRQDRVGNLRLAIYVLIGAVGFVLLIACANVANLLLARGAGRYRELALRMSLGARRAHIVRQLLTESIFLAVFAGLLGLILSISATGFLNRLVPGYSLRCNAPESIHAFAFTLLVSTATGLLFGSSSAAP